MERLLLHPPSASSNSKVMSAYCFIVLTVTNGAAASPQMTNFGECNHGANACLTTESISLLQTFVQVQPMKRTLIQTARDPAVVDPIGGCDLGELEWGVSIDGRDASLGPDGYHDFKPTLDTMQQVLANKSAYAELSLDIVEQIHNKCCAKYPYRKPWYGPPMSGKYVNTTAWLAEHFPRSGKWAWNGTEKFHGRMGWCISHCTDFELKHSLVKDLPRELLHIIYRQGGSGTQEQIDQILLRDDIDPRKMIGKLISKYNEDVKVAGSSSNLKMEAVARFSRSMAWLHPFFDNNGRLRNLLIQQEIRRLGLGRCAMMYNNNRDIYFTNTSEYAEKIWEGIDAADATRATGEHAWLNQTRVAAHLERFKNSAFDSCREDSDHSDQWGSID